MNIISCKCILVLVRFNVFFFLSKTNLGRHVCMYEYIYVLLYFSWIANQYDSVTSQINITSALFVWDDNKICKDKKW